MRNFYVCIVTCLLCSCTVLPVTPGSAAPGTIALGAYISTNNQRIEDNPGIIDQYASLVGHMPAIISFGSDLAHNYPFDRTTMDAVVHRGAMPMYTMDPAAYDGSGQQPQYSDAIIASGRYDDYFALWAREAALWAHPLLLRFAPEMNGWWSSWGTGYGNSNNNMPAQFIAMWQHVHDIFARYGATNVWWVWCANTDDPGTTPYAQDYPGDAYVNWVGMDGYNWGGTPYHTWKTFPQIFGPSYQELTAVTSKPMLIGETGSEEQGGNKAAWIIDSFFGDIPNLFPSIRAVVIFEAIAEHDWRMESSLPSLLAFRAVVASPLYSGNM